MKILPAFLFAFASTASAQQAPANHNDAATIYPKLAAGAGIVGFAQVGDRFAYMIDNKECTAVANVRGSYPNRRGHTFYILADGAGFAAEDARGCAAQQSDGRWLSVADLDGRGHGPVEIAWQAVPQHLDRVVYGAQLKAAIAVRGSQQAEAAVKEQQGQRTELLRRIKEEPIPTACEPLVQALEHCAVAYIEVKGQVPADFDEIRNLRSTIRAAIAVVGALRTQQSCQSEAFRYGSNQQLIPIVQAMLPKVPALCSAKLNAVRTQ